MSRLENLAPPVADIAPFRSADEEELQKIDEMLTADSLKPAAEVILRVQRAILLARLDRSLEARSEHFRVLEIDPIHRTNLLELGRLLVRTGHRKAALVIYNEAVKHYPEDYVSRVNLASTLLAEEDAAGARHHYEIALQMNSGLVEAHGGMYYALTRLGDHEQAAFHQKMSFGRKNLFEVPYRGTSKPIAVILLVSSTGGNTPVEKLLDDTVFQTWIVVADFYDPLTPLPEHQIIFNGIGDVEVAAEALVAARSLLAGAAKPVLNDPAAVLATSRSNNAERLAKLPGVRTARTKAYPRTLLAGDEASSMLARDGFTFPVLLRVPGFHMGLHFDMVETPAELAWQVNLLPTLSKGSSEILVMEYLDARGDDGCARKYRVLFVDGGIYPLHLAISSNWKIHYFSADMADRPDHREEEERFLEDMPAYLGAKAMKGLEAIRDSLGLDYGGVDFGLGKEGEILLFEANATMVVEHPDPAEIWDYRRAAVQRIHTAVRRMLCRN